jgi:hypothetical protein
MKKVARLILACFGMAITMNAAALEDYVGFSLAAVKSSENGVDTTSPAVMTMISARPNRYYGWEVQAGILGKVGPFSASGETDFCVAGFVPLGNSGINLYGKGGADAIYSSGSVFKTGLTYGAGVEYQHGKGIVRLGMQHSDVGKSPSFSARMIGITILVKLDK